MICSFLGHNSTPESVRPRLESAIRQVIERYPDVTFYVGHNGAFDRMVLSVLKSLSAEYADISYVVVLAYLSVGKLYDNVETVYPEGIENTPRKYAILYRNDWIVKQTDMVICYITHDFGGAAKFTEKARKKGKKVINIADCQTNE